MSDTTSSDGPRTSALEGLLRTDAPGRARCPGTGPVVNSNFGQSGDQKEGFFRFCRCSGFLRWFLLTSLSHHGPDKQQSQRKLRKHPPTHPRLTIHRFGFLPLGDSLGLSHLFRVSVGARSMRRTWPLGQPVAEPREISAGSRPHRHRRE